MAQSGRASQWPSRQLSGVKRTPQIAAAAAAIDPQRTLSMPL
jgi:hypothetical protein